MRSIRGLTDSEVQNSRLHNGVNELPPPEVESFWEKLKGNFQEPLIRILCIALAATVILAIFGFADWIEGMGIAIAVFAATFVSTYSEWKNESSFQQLQQEASLVKCNVFRNGEIVPVMITDVVVGDYVLLEAGVKIPADGVVVQGKVLVKQAALNGEFVGVPKIVPQELPYQPNDYDNFNDPHLVFRGSEVDDGEAVMRVGKVGKATMYGKLSLELNLADDRPSPLQCKLDSLAEDISKVGYLGSAFIAVSFLFKQFIIDQGWSLSAAFTYIQSSPFRALHDVVNAIILAIIIVVVAVPEGLPTMIAIVLSLNMRRLLHDKVLVRKLLGIETAGSLSILFCDKTGTLTKGVFTPEVFLSGDGAHYGTIDKVPTNLAQILTFSLQESSASFRTKTNQFLGGNATDRALMTFVSSRQLWVGDEGYVTVENVVLFNSIRKFSACQLRLSDAFSARYPYLTQFTPSPPSPSSSSSSSRNNNNINNNNNVITVVKGAPELLLTKCKSYYTSDGDIRALKDHRALEEEIEAISSRGVRVVIIATSRHALVTDPSDSQHTPSYDKDYAENEKEGGAGILNTHKSPPPDLTLVGIIGVGDQVRPSTKEAVQLCFDGGIQTVMITGDKKETAMAVASEIGLIPKKMTPSEESVCVVTSSQLRQMVDDQVEQILPRLRVVSRALPTDKSRLVRIAQQMGHVVGMTGDGVNDSAALRHADVGFAMGTGAEVAKEAADIVILDDNFASIGKAVMYGRTIFKSIRKFITFQSTVNLSSSLIVFLGPFLGLDFPLSLIQLLWVNIVMDTLNALAYGGSPPHLRYMHQKPIERTAPIISTYMWTQIIVNGLYIAAVSIYFLVDDGISAYFVRPDSAGTPVSDQKAFLTAFFCFFIFITNFNSFNVRTKQLNILDGVSSNRNFLFVVGFIFTVQIAFTYFGQKLLRTVDLYFNEWIMITCAAITIIPVDLFRKIIIVPRVKAWYKRVRVPAPSEKKLEEVV